ncbi:MAG TPA: hypothetical protein VFX88_26070 [Actinomycetota bacterium]|nr:hypothetical protein [Actinomycetota bacterium]
MTRRPRTSGALLALGLVLALLGPGAAAGSVTPGGASRSLQAGPVAGPEQGLVRDRGGRAPVAPGGTRDDRDRPGPALPAVAALTVAAAFTVVAARRAARPAGRQAAASAARAPPPLRPAAS